MNNHEITNLSEHGFNDDFNLCCRINTTTLVRFQSIEAGSIFGCGFLI